MKKCFKCHKEKPISDFYKHEMMADGHLGKCRECTKVDVRKNRGKKLRYYRNYDVERYQRPERHRDVGERATEWRRRNPEKAKAHQAVNYAVRTGSLVKQPCRDCGKVRGVHAHHADYSKPLDVIWLCAVCHSAEHRRGA